MSTNSTMSNDNVITTIEADGLATVTINRPEKHNAFDDNIIIELSTAFERVTASDARVMVLATEGKTFSAGADLGWMKRMASYSFEENLRDANALANMLKRLNTLPLPTIARVQGAAFGGGVGLVSCCDIAVATARASFCLSEVKIGMIPATISPYVINAIGERAARRYFTTAERFSAERAEQLGLVSEVVAEDQLDAAVSSLCQHLLANGPEAVKAAKQLVFDMSKRDINVDLIADSCKRIANIRASIEGQEGLTAFLEKRPAAWIKE